VSASNDKPVVALADARRGALVQGDEAQDAPSLVGLAQALPELSHAASVAWHRVFESEEPRAAFDSFVFISPRRVHVVHAVDGSAIAAVGVAALDHGVGPLLLRARRRLATLAQPQGEHEEGHG
jgi:hypothetical protein